MNKILSRREIRNVITLQLEELPIFDVLLQSTWLFLIKAGVKTHRLNCFSPSEKGSLVLNSTRLTELPSYVICYLEQYILSYGRFSPEYGDSSARSVVLKFEVLDAFCF